VPHQKEYEYTCVEPTWDFTILLPSLLSALRQIPPGARVLDIGCGNGAILCELQKHGNWRLSGVESSTSAVEICRSLGLDVVYCPDAAERLTEVMPMEAFDFVLATEVIEHLYNPQGFVEQAMKVLKSNGLILLSTPYHGWWKNSLISLSGHWDRHHDPLWLGGHIKFWSKRTLSQLLLKAGFCDISFRGAGRVPWLWKDMIMTARKPT
jgi:2-polyprenyl-3-methyl-5-hydroxy-6-metoxy-1,4-benzoquinol methylase